MDFVRMMEISKDLNLTPFESAQLNVELFATNLIICVGLQEAIRMDLECDAQSAAMLDDPEQLIIADMIKADQIAAAGKINTAAKMLDSMGINA
jgi:hypothetical protein